MFYCSNLFVAIKQNLVILKSGQATGLVIVKEGQGMDLVIGWNAEEVIETAERVVVAATGQMEGSDRTEDTLDEKEDQEGVLWVADLHDGVAILTTDRGIVL